MKAKFADAARFLAFVAIVVVAGPLLGPVYVFLVRALHIPRAYQQALEPRTMLLNELLLLIVILAATAILGATERRPFWSYGFTPSRDALRLWGRGVGYGVGSTVAIALLMFAFGGFRISGIALHGSDWLVYPLLWLLTMLCVGFAEEGMFRGYPLFVLSRVFGFWPAAVVMTLLFGAAHVSKTGENAIDISSVMLLGFFTCFTLWRTGSLWLAAGFHTAFDYMQFFVIGTPNGSQEPMGHLFAVSFPGPAWVNGGVLGTEASAFVFPVAIALFWLVNRRYPQARMDAGSQPHPATLPT